MVLVLACGGDGSGGGSCGGGWLQVVIIHNVMCVCFMEDLFFLYVDGIGSNSIICLHVTLDN